MLTIVKFVSLYADSYSGFPGGNLPEKFTIFQRKKVNYVYNMSTYRLFLEFVLNNRL